MALRLACPLCRTEVVMDEAFAGRDVLCPKCGGRFTAPSIMASPAPVVVPAATETPAQPVREALDDLPRFRRREESLSAMVTDAERQWATTRTGLGLMFWAAIAVAVLVVPVLVLGGILDAHEKQNPDPENPPPAVIVAVLGVLGLGCIMLLFGVIYFVGMCLCCSAPPESGARGRAIGSVLLAIVLVVMLGAFSVYAFVKALEMQRVAPGQPPVSPEVLGGFVLCFGLVYAVYTTMWMLFHRAVARYFHNVALARNVALFLVVWLLCLVLNAAFQSAVGGRPANDPHPAAGLAVLVALASNLLLFIWFLAIVRRTRTTILEGAARLERHLPGEDEEMM